jgi:hypothetical protein
MCLPARPAPRPPLALLAAAYRLVAKLAACFADKSAWALEAETASLLRRRRRRLSGSAWRMPLGGPFVDGHPTGDGPA